MLVDQSALLLDNPLQHHYGVAVVDADDDQAFEVLVAASDKRNLLLKWNGSVFLDVADDALADADGHTLCAAGGDLDGDGREEIYLLSSGPHAGHQPYADRLLDWRNGNWLDLFTAKENRETCNLLAGRSVACIDRFGTGRYGFFVTNYGGPMCLFELDDAGPLRDVAPEAGVDRTTGGIALLALPLVSEHRMDILAINEQGPNLLYRNNGDGTFRDVALPLGVRDGREHGGGVAVLDATGRGQLGFACGNWEGPHRLFVRQADGRFENLAPPEMAQASRVRTVIAADFDNDGHEELFFNNHGQPNRLFGYRDGAWQPIDIGDALESDGAGTGAAVGDFSQDGRLELLITHGDTEEQQIKLYTSAPSDHHWLRIAPLTRFGAPARGALVYVELEGRRMVRAIDAGSGYLCQMEPVAHFGLGTRTEVDRVLVRWPDGTTATLDAPDVNQMVRVPFPQ